MGLVLTLLVVACQASALLALRLVAVSDRLSRPFSVQVLQITNQGYSWKSNQYGLTIDNIESYELVLPDGTIQTVTPQDEDLWFGLRVSDTILPLSHALCDVLSSFSGRL